MPKVEPRILDKINTIQESEAPGYFCFITKRKDELNKDVFQCRFFLPDDRGHYCNVTINPDTKIVVLSAFSLAENDTVGFSFVEKVVHVFGCSLRNN